MWPSVQRSDLNSIYTCQALNTDMVEPKETSYVLDMNRKYIIRFANRISPFLSICFFVAWPFVMPFFLFSPYNSTKSFFIDLPTTMSSLLLLTFVEIAPFEPLAFFSSSCVLERLFLFSFHLLCFFFCCLPFSSLQLFRL